jgi:hypothetical protein
MSAADKNVCPTETYAPPGLLADPVVALVSQTASEMVFFTIMRSDPRIRATSPLRRMATGLLGAAIVFWALLSLCAAWHRVGSIGRIRVHFGHDIGDDSVSQVARLYLPLRETLRNISEVGFVTQSQDPDQAMLRYYMAQSMLTPTLVVQSSDRPVVITFFDDDSHLEAFLQSHPFAIRQRLAAGLAILDRKGP